MRHRLVIGLAGALAMAVGAIAAASAQAPRGPVETRTRAGVRTASTPRTDQCALCHRGIDDAHPKKALTCITCHKGDATATDAKSAHAGMLSNPSDLRVVDQTCGKCHQTITAKVKSSIMAH